MVITQTPKRCRSRDQVGAFAGHVFMRKVQVAHRAAAKSVWGAATGPHVFMRKVQVAHRAAAKVVWEAATGPHCNCYIWEFISQQQAIRTWERYLLVPTGWFCVMIH